MDFRISVDTNFWRLSNPQRLYEERELSDLLGDLEESVPLMNELGVCLIAKYRYQLNSFLNGCCFELTTISWQTIHNGHLKFYHQLFLFLRSVSHISQSTRAVSTCVTESQPHQVVTAYRCPASLWVPDRRTHWRILLPNMSWIRQHSRISCKNIFIP